MAKIRTSKIRTSKIERHTKETRISIELNLDGTGKFKIKTPIEFLNHMLENFSRHSRFDLNIRAEGDIDVDDHHLVEDIGICLGQALVKAMGDKTGICRMGSAIVPLDDALATVAVDLSGRGYARIDMRFLEFKDAKLGGLSKENIPHFFESFAINGEFNLYIHAEGGNDHHKVEACFKAIAKALYDATRIIGGCVPSTKGVV